MDCPCSKVNRAFYIQHYSIDESAWVVEQCFKRDAHQRVVSRSIMNFLILP